jgi:hypothetical protein
MAEIFWAEIFEIIVEEMEKEFIFWALVDCGRSAVIQRI